MKSLSKFLILLILFSTHAYSKDLKPLKTKLKPYQIEITNLPGSPEYKKYMMQAADCIAAYQFEESNTACSNALLYKPDDFLARALICLNYFEMGEQIDIKAPKGKSKREELYNKMIEIAEEGIKKSPNRGECYFMRGLARARKATTAGIIYNLFKARSIEKDWLKAASLKSEYVTPTGEDLLASCYLALGVYYRICPSFFLLKLIFGISGNIDKSIQYCEEAYTIDTKRIELVKEMGISYITRGLKKKNNADIEKGKEYLRMVPSLPYRLKTDPIDVEHSKMLLEHIELCPGYSRDQQQEISDEKVKEALKKQEK
jgi:hypothetical protein